MYTIEQLQSVTRLFYPVKSDGLSVLHTEKTPNELNKISYNYCATRPPSTYDTIDKAFLINREQFKYKDFSGFHDYGGYSGLYKPSLTEEAEILLKNMSIKEILSYERIYVKPMTCSFDETEDKHWGTTRFYFVNKNKSHTNILVDKSTQTDATDATNEISTQTDENTIIIEQDEKGKRKKHK
jgi:hypothetical protein